MPTSEEYVQMAAKGYKPDGGIPPVGWELSEYAKPPNRWGFCVAIYRNPIKKEIVISFKGTDEWIHHLGNAGLAFGHVPPQLADAETKVREVLATSNLPPASLLAATAGQILPPIFFLRFITAITNAILAFSREDYSAAEDKIVALRDDYLFVSQEKANLEGQIKQLQAAWVG